MNYKMIDYSTPKISIILPIYNGEKYLEETLQAVRSSDYENWELICINDGSNDKSADICKRYCEIDERFIMKKKMLELLLPEIKNYHWRQGSIFVF